MNDPECMILDQLSKIQADIDNVLDGCEPVDFQIMFDVACKIERRSKAIKKWAEYANYAETDTIRCDKSLKRSISEA